MGSGPECPRADGRRNLLRRCWRFHQTQGRLGRVSPNQPLKWKSTPGRQSPVPGPACGVAPVQGHGTAHRRASLLLLREGMTNRGSVIGVIVGVVLLAGAITWYALHEPKLPPSDYLKQGWAEHHKGRYS